MGQIRDLCINPDGCMGALKVARDHRHLVIEWRDVCTCMHDDVYIYNTALLTTVAADSECGYEVRQQ